MIIATVVLSRHYYATGAVHKETVLCTVDTDQYSEADDRIRNYYDENESFSHETRVEEIIFADIIP